MNSKRAFLFILLLVATTVCSHADTAVGIPTEKFNYVASTQEEHEWCWAASSQMILNWFEIDVSQRDVVQRIKGRITDQGASEKDITAALSGKVRLRSGKTAFVHTMSSAGPPSPSVIVSQLSSRNPILLALMTGPDRGHTVVLTGATYYNTPEGPHISSVTIRDPYPTPYNVMNHGRSEISGEALHAFVHYIRRSWIVWVTPANETLNR